MTMPLIISISGVRGVIGESLGPREAVEFAQAYGTFLRRSAAPEKTPQVVLGRDSRPSGAMMAGAVAAGLMAVGCEPVQLGIVTTPGAALMVRHLGADGGVVITASHNPTPWNGLKFLRRDGAAYPDHEARQIHQLYADKQFDAQRAGAVAQTSHNSKTHAVHVDTVLQICDKMLIRARRFRVVLDSINGAGCVVTAQLLSELGCELIHLNERPTGLFAHLPEPTAENLAELGPQVVRRRAAVGLAQDPDADRLALVDEKGTYIGEEYTLALAAKYVFSRRQGPAAANLSTSRMIDDLAAQSGCTVIRTPVGEAHVANAMLEHHCVIGGEGNGGVIDLRVVPVRDSLVAIALVLQLLAETNQPLSALVAQIPRYHMIKTKFNCPADQAQAVLDRVRRHYAERADPLTRLDTRDGIRIDLPDGWVQVRASNTEPIIRIIAEARAPQTAERLIRDLRALAGL